MSGISFPVQVALVLRRLVNVISTLSVSNQCLQKPTTAEEKTRLERDGRWTMRTTLSSQKILDWRSVLWNMTAQSINPSPVHASTTSLPWWSYRTLAMSAMSAQSQKEPEQGPPDPGPAHNAPEKLPEPKAPKITPPQPSPPEIEPDLSKLDTIHQLLLHPALFDPLRTPRYPIVLSHGLYGFDSRGPSSFPSMRMHYWSNVLNTLRDKVGAEVIITSVPGTGSIVSRSEAMHRQMQIKARGRGVNFLAHSMGGLDCRHLISHIQPNEYVPLSLTSISTPHRGSPFMDWCAVQENIGIGKLKREEFLSRSAASRTVDEDVSPATADLPSPPESSTPKAKDSSFSLSSLPSSFTTLLLGVVDSPAYANLTSTYLNTVFNPQTPDDPRVKYFSVAGRMPGVSIWHPFWLPKMVLDGVEEKEREKLRKIWENEGGIDPDPIWRREREWGNDGLVTVQSAKWGEFLGIMEGCDHWEMRGARGIEFGVDLPALPVLGLGGPGNANTARSASQGDGWGLMDWNRFVGAWKKEEKIQRDAASAASGHQPSTPHEQEQLKKNTDDALIKISAEKISSAFDWLVEQAPVPRLGSKGKIVEDAKDRAEEGVAQMHGDVTEMQKHMKTEGKSRKTTELANKRDLERFYVALSRKLYDEGL
ncbi:Alpha/Beta hydrolase protein [Mycena rosella]|uniref:Alpha/Beta hydrolase protein n=1 Tax=Mycena rosella TaxID=1033263 RepID=A0AAD7DYC3_MYCRO|nr:Alpha/Beta hydrolase protein [Mycena rosella]